MRNRILFGAAAWLLGAATATAGSLLAVSLIGQGITGSSGTLLSPDAVNKALATEQAEPTGSPGSGAAAVADSPSPSASASASHGARPSGSPSPTATASTQPPVPAATSSAPSGTGTVLGSAGGYVVASCLAAGAYLDSWSPSQGYEVSGVVRGPAQSARVTFEADTGAVTMVVSCSGGVPSATSSSRKPGDE